MADRLNIPADGWRPRQPAPLLDPQLKRIILMAGGVMGVLALCYGGYTMIGRRPHTVPVVEADPRPVRVRPDNPGGLQVVGADELVGIGQGQEVMAPAPEAPAPEMLRAKIAAENRAQAAKLTPPAQPISVATPPPEPATPIAAMPEQRAAPPAPAPAAVKPASPAKSGGTAQVQLASLETEQLAKTEWSRLEHRMPGLLGARQPAVTRWEHDGKVFFRLRTGGFADAAAAAAFCTQVRASGNYCSVANF